MTKVMEYEHRAMFENIAKALIRRESLHPN
jgi:hypothetical protein